MWVRTMLLAITQVLATELLAALGTRPAGALMTTPSIELYTASSAPIGPGMSYGQFTVATFSGYAITALPTLTSVLLDARTMGLIGNVTFTATVASPFVGDTIIGYMLTNGTGTLYGAEQFSTPVGIGMPGNFLSLDFAFPMPMFLPV